MLRQALRKLHQSSSERLVAAILIIAGLTALLVACATERDNPIPPAPQRWVTDTASLLSESTHATLDARLEAYEHQTGHQVVLYIGSTSSLPLDELATKTFQTWGLGRKGKDDGVLILVLAADHQIAIEVGYGLEGQLPDALTSRIINDVIVPQMRAGNADAAIGNGVDAVLAAIEGKAARADAPTPAPTPKAEKKRAPLGSAHNILLGLLALGFLILLITNPSLALYLLVVLSSGGRGGGGGGFGDGGFSGGGGRSGGGGARGSW